MSNEANEMKKFFIRVFGPSFEDYKDLDFDSVRGWDSMKFMDAIFELEAVTKKKISIRSLQEIRNINDLCLAFGVEVFSHDEG